MASSSNATRMPSSRDDGPSSSFATIPWALSASAALGLVLLLSSSFSSRRDDNNTHRHPDGDGDGDDDIYRTLGVRPPHDRIKVVRIPLLGIRLPLARWAWKAHGRLLPLLHLFEERPRTGDVFVNLRVVWCKLLASLDPASPAYEGERERLPPDQHRWRQPGRYATYRMLPRWSIKWPLRYLGLWRIFPRWMHANIELRTVYLQNALDEVLRSEERRRPDRGDGPDDDDDERKNNICVIVLGGGYDPRGAKLLAAAAAGSGRDETVVVVYELDLPPVVEAKRRLLRRAGFGAADDDRGSGNRGGGGVRFEAVDLNEDAAVDRVLDSIRSDLIGMPPPRPGRTPSPPSGEGIGSRGRWRVVLVSEAVLMYLDPGKAERIVKGVAERFGRGNGRTAGDGGIDDNGAWFHDASFVFADRLIRRNGKAARWDPRRMQVPATPDLSRAEESRVRTWLRDGGWDLKELLFKPGGTRHLGIATTKISI